MQIGHESQQPLREMGHFSGHSSRNELLDVMCGVRQGPASRTGPLHTYQYFLQLQAVSLVMVVAAES